MKESDEWRTFCRAAVKCGRGYGPCGRNTTYWDKYGSNLTIPLCAQHREMLEDTILTYAVRNLRGAPALREFRQEMDAEMARAQDVIAGLREQIQTLERRSSQMLAARYGHEDTEQITIGG
jgi:hypothetical protein